MLDKIDVDDDLEWAERSNLWHEISTAAEPHRRKRERRNFPLILSGFGVALKVENGSLIIRNGFTHHPQKREEFRFFKGQLDVPERIIMFDGNGSLSFSVIDWLADQGVVFVRIGWDGQSTTVIGGTGSPTNAEKLRWQFELENNSTKRNAFAAGLISQKLKASLETISSHFPESEKREKAILKIHELRGRLAAGFPDSIDELLAIEGADAQAYFSVWHGMEMNWLSGDQNRIPQSWLFYDSRSSVLSGKKWKNWKASNPVNAMLNYAYAVLEADTRVRIVSEGYDPRIGLLHAGRHRDKEDSFVFDMMEPLRPVVDRAILSLVRGRSFSAADFVLRVDGVCRLAPQLARAVIQPVQSTLSVSS